MSVRCEPRRKTDGAEGLGGIEMVLQRLVYPRVSACRLVRRQLGISANMPLLALIRGQGASQISLLLSLLGDRKR